MPAADLGKLQTRFTALLALALPNVEMVSEVAPAWLVRPGREELANLWSLARAVYRDLTGLELPERMPSRERRRLDIVLTHPDGAQQIVEFDERQHFTGARLMTLRYYNGIDSGFDVSAWAERCAALEGREPKGGFARPKPPLFPGDGGRHRQRAFRDFLADALPIQYGWLPTRRFQDRELIAIEREIEPAKSLAAVWNGFAETPPRKKD